MAIGCIVLGKGMALFLAMAELKLTAQPKELKVTNIKTKKGSTKSLNRPTIK